MAFYFHDTTVCQATLHHLHRFRIIVNQRELAAFQTRGFAQGAAAGEEVQQVIAGVGMNADDATDDGQGFLSGVAGLLFAGDNGVPPHVGGRLAAGGLFGADQAGRHVGDAVHGVVVEGVVPGILRVPQDVVVLGRPAGLGAAAVVVGPDDLVDEGVAAENLVQHHLAIVDFPVIDVEEKAAVVIQHAVCLLHAGAEEPDVVVEDVGVFAGPDDLGAVAAPLEPSAVAVGIRRHLDAGAGLRLAGVEWGIDVDQLECAVRQRPQDIQIIAEYNLAHPIPPKRGGIIPCANDRRQTDVDTPGESNDPERPEHKQPPENHGRPDVYDAAGRHGRQRHQDRAAGHRRRHQAHGFAPDP